MDLDIEKKLFKELNFKNISDLDKNILSDYGLYCFRLKKEAKFQNKYQNTLDKREYKYIYIGKAEKQTLFERLNQELKHTKPGTFFRGIGCVLGYIPIKGHLYGKSNQNNYKFSKTDTEEIIKWLNENIEVSIISHSGDYSIENELIKKYCPLLNTKHNPLKLAELAEDRERCRDIARSKV